jgi:hypothetical protein
MLAAEMPLGQIDWSASDGEQQRRSGLGNPAAASESGPQKIGRSLNTTGHHSFSPIMGISLWA